MARTDPRISVIVPTYEPGAGLDRVLSSLAEQTLAADDFEVIMVDDGSPDDTFARISAASRQRPNVRVAQIANSGWPSRPRNVGTSMARGEYVLYMDHDDSLFPDALRRAVDYASQSGADVLSVKESKTSDAWWCMPSLAEGNATDLKQQHRIDRLLPMVPHKVYRREFLLENDITFPEGRRMLWEDVYFNVETYAKAERVAILADAPLYLWHSSETNNSKTYGPTDLEFWDRLDDLMAFIDRTLGGVELAEERRTALMHQYRSRILRRLGKALPQASLEQERSAQSPAPALCNNAISRQNGTSSPGRGINLARLRCAPDARTCSSSCTDTTDPSRGGPRPNRFDGTMRPWPSTCRQVGTRGTGSS